MPIFLTLNTCFISYFKFILFLKNESILNEKVRLIDVPDKVVQYCKTKAKSLKEVNYVYILIHGKE